MLENLSISDSSMFLTSIKFLSEINITNNRPNKFQNSFLMIHFSIDPKGLYTSYIEQKGDKGSKDAKVSISFPSKWRADKRGARMRVTLWGCMQENNGTGVKSGGGAKRVAAEGG